MPYDPLNYAFLLEVYIGPAGGEGEERFSFVVWSPVWLQQKYGEDAAVLGHVKIVVFDYSFARIKAVIEGMVARLEGKDWSDLANKIGRYGTWELQDETVIARRRHLFKVLWDGFSALSSKPWRSSGTSRREAGARFRSS